MRRLFIGFSVFLLLIVSCASIVNSMQSVSEKTKDRTPYYVDLKKNVSIPTDSVYYLPVSLSQEKTFFSPNLKSLQEAMQTCLETKVNNKIMNLELKGSERPQVSFGIDDFFDHDEEGRDEDPPLVFIIKQPSKNWRAGWKLQKPGYCIAIELNVSAYKVRQKNWKGSKEIEVGTNYDVAVPWLTSLDDPVPVVQIVGMVLDKNGKVLRAGAEGFFVKRTSFGFSILGISDTIDDKDVDKIIHSHRRNDLEGKPLAYKVAFDTLIKQLLQ